MKPLTEFPLFDLIFPDLNRFILELVEAYDAGKINSWDDLEERVRHFYTPTMMDAIEAKAPGWKKMASYSNGITLTHVTCVFLGMFMLPEFQALTFEQQQIAKWIILFHDIDKVHVRGKRDTMHAFNSGVVAAHVLPKLGFPITDNYHELIEPWSKFTQQAYTVDASISQKPDNKKLPEIIEGIEQLFDKDTAAALITKTVLLHISLDVDKNYPTPTALKDEEIRSFIAPKLFPLLKIMMFSDNEGWSLFDPEVKAQQRRDALSAFERIQELVETAK